MTTKCGKHNVEMQSTGTQVIHNKEVEEFECPVCHDIVRLEVINDRPPFRIKAKFTK